LLRYSETRPRKIRTHTFRALYLSFPSAFIRELLENVGAEIDPIRLIRRIKNGLEIPGLKEALIKILWDFNLQVSSQMPFTVALTHVCRKISLMEGCQNILHGDCADLAVFLHSRQTSGILGGRASMDLLNHRAVTECYSAAASKLCPICGLLLFPTPQVSSFDMNAQTQPKSLALIFLCRHVVHAHCVKGGDSLPRRTDDSMLNFLQTESSGLRLGGGIMRDTVGSKIALWVNTSKLIRPMTQRVFPFLSVSVVRARLEESCPVCEHKADRRR
jgi:vacuolar protein sorting-associated protein 41